MRRLIGVGTLKRDLTASAEVLELLTPGFVAGDYRAAPSSQICGLGQAQEGYRKVAAGSTGRGGPAATGIARWQRSQDISHLC